MLLLPFKVLFTAIFSIFGAKKGLVVAWSQLEEGLLGDTE